MVRIVASHTVATTTHVITATAAHHLVWMFGLAISIRNEIWIFFLKLVMLLCRDRSVLSDKALIGNHSVSIALLNASVVRVTAGADAVFGNMKIFPHDKVCGGKCTVDECINASE
jgi:hypothetical protein